MSRKTVSAIIMSLLVLGTLTLASDIQQVKASGTIYIRADGSVDPPTAPISTVDNATYTLTGNITSDADGIVIERDNTIVDAAGYTIQGTGAYPYKGIDLSGRSNVTIKNMEINTFSYGIWIDSSDYNSVIGNNITGDVDTIQLYYSSNNSIVGNNITASWGRGFALNYSSSNTISGNNIANNKNYGIGLFSYSDYNIVSGNNITDNDKGVLVYGYSSNNSVIGNNITGSGTGILVDDSSNNRFYHNNFIENRYPTYVFPGYANVWDDGYPSGGNYWSDYKGTDIHSGHYQNETGSDYIGDIPYIIDAKNLDNYPLMNSWYRILGDINFDGKVSLQDLVLLALAYGSRPGDAKWNPNADINGNGVVDLADLVILALHYGQPKYDYTDWYNGLVGYWKLDEGAGNMTADSSGNGNNGTLINGPAWVSSKYGEALNLNGTNYVSVPDSTSLQLQNFSLEAWIYMKEEPLQDSFASIIRRFGTDSEMSAIGYWLGFWQGNLELTVGDGLGGGVTPVGITQSVLTLNEWHHIVATFDDESNQVVATLYIDGLAKASNTISSSFILPFPPYYVSSPLMLGNGMSNCTIDNAMVYNRTLSPKK